MSTYSTREIKESFPQGVEGHYWHVARNRFVAKHLQTERAQGQTILDIGCGPGLTVDYLRRHGYQAFGCEPAQVFTASEHVFPSKMPQDLDPAFRQTVHTLLYLDVLEHLKDPLQELKNVQRLFPHAQRIFVTVPARQEIWSCYDEFFGHFRRYDRPSLVALLQGAFEAPVETGYFFHSLYWAARLQKAASVDRKVSMEITAPGTLHRILGELFYWESRALPKGLVGSSLWASARLRSRQD